MSKNCNGFRLNRAGISAVTGPREHGNETSNFINTQIRICTLSTYQETPCNNEIFFTTKTLYHLANTVVRA